MPHRSHDTVGHVLNCAADYIERHGWLPDSFTEVRNTVALTDSPADVRTALINCLGRHSPALDTVEVALLKYLGLTWRDRIETWNDHPDRTNAGVVATLRLAAESYRNMYL